MPSEWASTRVAKLFAELGHMEIAVNRYRSADGNDFTIDDGLPELKDRIALSLDAVLEEGERRGAEKEREACARFCEVGDSDEYPIGDGWVAEDEEGRVRLQLAAAIRARGDATEEPKP